MNPSASKRYLVIGVAHDPDIRERLATDLERFCAGQLVVETYADGHTALDRLMCMNADKERVALFIVDHDLPGRLGGDLLVQAHQLRPHRTTRKLLLTAAGTVPDFDVPLNAGALNARVDNPWTTEQLDRALRLLITEFFAQHAPDDLEQVTGLIDVSILSELFSSAEREQRAVHGQLQRLQRSFFADRMQPDDYVESAMIDEIDRTLDNPPRRVLPAGSILLRRGEPVDGIWILISGRVHLYREVHGREVTFHARTVGRIIGLMAVTEARPSFFDCRAETEINVIWLSLEQLDYALRHSPTLAVHFVTVLLRGLNRRNKRAVNMQLEINDLNETLAEERDHLRQALDQLQAAQGQLVESEKMVALGRLVAGIAHELNNPVAAISRNADFLQKDLEALADGHQEAEPLALMLQAALRREPISTRDERRYRKEMTKTVDDPTARRLVKIGILSAEDYALHFDHIPVTDRDTHLERMETFYQIGASLRNVSTCSTRISALVQSLRSYARKGDEISVAADLHAGLEETLLLFGHQIREITVQRSYGDVGTIQCRPGQLNQVWTNLLSNAIEAMKGNGTLEIATDCPDPDHVRIRIIDSGPGIPPDALKDVFELNFTSKQGRVDFGLGLGLTISRDIVHQHNGSIHVESQPGRTCFCVTLPRKPIQQTKPSPTGEQEETA